MASASQSWKEERGAAQTFADVTLQGGGGDMVYFLFNHFQPKDIMDF